MITGKFQPLANTSNIATPGLTSQSVAINYPPIAQGSYILRIVNDSTQTVFFSFGNSSVTAIAATSTPILSGSTETFECPTAYEYIAVITSTVAAVGNIYFTIGLGD